MRRRDTDVSRSSLRRLVIRGSQRRWSLFLTVSLSLTLLTCLIATHHPTTTSRPDRFREVHPGSAHSLPAHEALCGHCVQQVSIASPSVQPGVSSHFPALHLSSTLARLTTPSFFGTAVPHCMSGIASALCQLAAVLLVMVGWTVHRARRYGTAATHAVLAFPQQLLPVPIVTSSRLICVQFRCFRN